MGHEPWKFIKKWQEKSKIINGFNILPARVLKDVDESERIDFLKNGKCTGPNLDIRQVDGQRFSIKKLFVAGE